jgi:phage terminase small subunit
MSDDIGHLSEAAQKLFRRIQRQWAIRDEPGRTVLVTALEALDRLRQAQELVKIEGLQTKDRFGQKRPHPMLQVEKEARAHWLQSLKALNLDLESLESEVK